MTEDMARVDELVVEVTSPVELDVVIMLLLVVDGVSSWVEVDDNNVVEVAVGANELVIALESATEVVDVEETHVLELVVG